MKTKLSKTHFALVLGTLASLAVVNSYTHLAFANVSEDPLRLGDIDPTKEAGKEKSATEGITEKSARIVELSSRLGVPASELAEFFKGLNENGRQMSASSVTNWQEILTTIDGQNGRNATADDVAKSDALSEIVGSYIKLRKSGLADSFHISEKDLVEISQSWSANQKANFNKVMRRAGEIAKTNSVGTMDQAFEKALDEMGYLKKYQQSCPKA